MDVRQIPSLPVASTTPTAAPGAPATEPTATPASTATCPMMSSPAPQAMAGATTLDADQDARTRLVRRLSQQHASRGAQAPSDQDIARFTQATRDMTDMQVKQFVRYLAASGGPGGGAGRGGGRTSPGSAGSGAMPVAGSTATRTPGQTQPGPLPSVNGSEGMGGGAAAAPSSGGSTSRPDSAPVTGLRPGHNRLR